MLKQRKSADQDKKPDLHQSGVATFFIIECMKSGYDCTNNDSADCCMHQEFRRIQNMLQVEFKRTDLASMFNESEKA